MTSRPCSNVMVALCAAAAMLIFFGCASSTRVNTTRAQHADLNEMTQRMAQSLARSDFLAQRDQDSSPIVIMINKVENLTSDIIPPAEQWMLMQRVRSSLPLINLAKSKNLIFQIEPERYAMLRRARPDLEQTDPIEARIPTHALTASFISATRAQVTDGLTRDRADHYYVEYVLSEIGSRNVVWTDRFEFKRQASGLAVD